MTSTLWGLTLSMTLFVVSHLALSGPAVRPRLVAALGENGFRGAYSIVSIVLIVWVAKTYAGAPFVEIWFPPTALRHLSLSVMPFAFILLVGGLTTPNPTLAMANTAAIAGRGPTGMLKITRHPMMWGIALWGITHLLAKGDAASLILFGGMTVLALVGARAIDAKKERQLGDRWTAYEAETSFVPFVALAAGRTQLGFGEIGWWRIGLGGRHASKRSCRLARAIAPTA